MTRRHCPGASLLLACVLLAPGSAAAQTAPRLEIATGVGVVFTSELWKSAEGTPRSWLVAGAWRLRDAVALVGEVSGERTRASFRTADWYALSVPCTGSPYSPVGVPCPPGGTVGIVTPQQGGQGMDLYAVVTGIRYVPRPGRVGPFVQVLVGAARITWDAHVHELPAGAVRVEPSPDPTRPDDTVPEAPFTVRRSKPALQVGAGLAIPVWRRVGARVALDVRRLLGEPRFTQQLRVSVQGTVALGRD